MSDKLLIRRLRKHPVWTMDKQNITSDAADLIEQLQAEVKRWRKQSNMNYMLLCACEKRTFNIYNDAPPTPDAKA